VLPGLAERRVAVRRLRVQGADDALRLRVGVDRLLAGADVRPSRLPPAAILVVRTLADPRPGQLDTRGTAPAPAWERAVTVALDDQLAAAARPAAGRAVPGDANAVVFADAAELLACLGRDWSRGALASWWWRALRLDTPPAALGGFAATPAAVPAAFHRLARDGTAEALAARLPPAAAARLARAVAQAFGAGTAAEAALAEPPPGGGPEQPPERPRPWAAPGRRPPGAPPAAPWAGPLREAGIRGGVLLAEQEVLVGLALVLRQDPTRARAPGFAAAARAWRARRPAHLGGPPPSPSPARPATAAVPAAAPAAAGTDGPAAAPGPAPTATTTTRHRPPPRGRDGTAPPRSRGRPAAVPPRAAVVDQPPVPDRPAAAHPHPQAGAAAGDGSGDRAVEPLTAAVETRLGGLFHLVLVGQQLGLYGDFTTPGRPGIALGVWDFVTLLGRRLLGRPPSDPVWRLLADLAGRPAHRPPGLGYRPPRAWRVPRAWLAPVPGRGRWGYADHQGRLLLLHPAGFPVVDAAGADLGRELRRYQVARAWPVRPARTPGTARQRWVAHLAAYVRVRLAAALGVPPSKAAPLALRRPAHVLVTDTQIDVVSALDDLAIEVRLAGLDRDPGHVPAAGRTLRFHFR
jgi:hypothetical protein